MADDPQLQTRRAQPVTAAGLPNFLIIGAIKAGTTSLWSYLRDHPQVFVASAKEPHFFSRNWELGREWYEHHFENAGDSLAVGEGSTSYSKYPHEGPVPARMAKVIPGVRLIYMVRHPIERIRSHYVHETVHGPERRPIEEAFQGKNVYVDASRYAFQIEQYLQHFPSQQLLVITSESLLSQRRATMGRVCEFLGIDGTWESPFLEHEFNRTSDKKERRPLAVGVRRLPGYRRLTRFAPPWLKMLNYRLTTRPRVAPEQGIIPPSLRAELEERLGEDVGRLRRYLGPDFDGWGIG
ncbi:MAG: sulfotransferase domain-containing protein [Actinomycetota bacterium]|nr:sulfotransferase domain-containing protein [Actinomycetota bacterium]